MGSNRSNFNSNKDGSRKEAGRTGEWIAAEFLKKKGFKIIERNFRRPWGEIDIIAERAGVVRFIEVKTLSQDLSGNVSRERGLGQVSRESNDHYRPEEQAHSWKLRKVARTAEMYMNSRNDFREYQVDVVGVLLDKRARIGRCRLFEQVL